MLKIFFVCSFLCLKILDSTKVLLAFSYTLCVLKILHVVNFHTLDEYKNF